ncbi:MAG: hypothetical protein ACPG31_09365 [Planctomycetota bacterium]
MRPYLTWIFTSIRGFGWLPFAFFLFHVVVSQVFEAYLRLPGLDIPMHFLGGSVITWFLWRSLRHPTAVEALGPRRFQADILLAGLGVGTVIGLWEFAEWSTDALGITEAQVGLDDTMLDMFLGLAGGWCYLAWAVGWRKSNQA